MRNNDEEANLGLDIGYQLCTSPAANPKQFCRLDQSRNQTSDMNNDRIARNTIRTAGTNLKCADTYRFGEDSCHEY